MSMLVAAGRAAAEPTACRTRQGDQESARCHAIPFPLLDRADTTREHELIEAT